MTDSPSSPPNTVGSQQTPPGTSIRLSEFSLSAGGKPLLVDASATFPAGKLTLVLGCSGVGKSLLMRILAGLIERDHGAIQYSGNVQFEGESGASSNRDHLRNPVAVVFQSYALFDELSPRQNIEIAIEHSAQKNRTASSKAAEELLKELGVPSDRPTSVLSGGQQQRLAIARAISMETDVVLYDEPTSGLDANTAAQVAEFIRETQTRFQRTSIVVTHDFAALRSIADHVVLLNHHTRQLQEVPREDWDKLQTLLGVPPSVEEQAQPQPSIARRLLNGITNSLAATGDFAEQVFLLPYALLPLWRSFRCRSRRLNGCLPAPKFCRKSLALPYLFSR